MKDVNPSLIEFIEKRLGKTDEKITRAATIENFYGIAELDTLIFYDQFLTEFSIAIPDDLNISNHISPVGFHDLRHILKRLLSKTYRARTGYRDLSIGELEEMIRTKKWTI